MTEPDGAPCLDPTELERRINENLRSYEGRSAFECFALVMGKAQILEFGLKNLLSRECGAQPDEMERWTLGTVARELEKRGFRADYVERLREFVKHRNYMAHEMLANNAIFRVLAPSMSERFEFKQLHGPAHELELLLIVHDWIEEHRAWRAAASADGNG